MNEKKQWYAIYTRRHWEKKLANRLERHGIESYCPLNTISKQWADRKKIVYEPLFPSYVFVHITLSEHSYIKRIQQDIKFVHWLGKPAVIKDDEIKAIKDLLSQFRNVQVEKANVSLNDEVKITNGAFIFQEGTVIEVHTKNVKVYLGTLGYCMIAQFDKSNVEILHPYNRKSALASGQ